MTCCGVTNKTQRNLCWQSPVYSCMCLCDV